jgi:asparagine synthase (glutamine-hydrolysing)
MGVLLESGVFLGSRRLAILDLTSSGRMPMQSHDGRYWIVHNGEVYNFRELRADLEQTGHRFVSGTDTEVLVNLYARFGPGMLSRLNGMFAFAIWDTVRRRLFLARDRLGVKPLYYVARGGRLLFASEIKALPAAGEKLTIQENNLPELLCHRYIAGEKTPFEGIRRLLPGHYLEWEKGAISTRCWWDLSRQVGEDVAPTLREPLGWFADTFDDAVRIRTISDVPVGVLLSGGLDSSSVAASLGASGYRGLSSFTVRFKEKGYDEGPLADAVARRWGFAAHSLQVDDQEVLQLLRSAMKLNDEPLVHGNDIHLLEIAKLAKSHVTVLLSGEGADELLGGYVRYRPLRNARLLSGLGRAGISKLLLSSRSRRLRKLARYSRIADERQLVLFNACDVYPDDLPMVGYPPEVPSQYRWDVLGTAQQLYPSDCLRQAMFLDQHTFLCSILDRNDRMTMGASIECRVPFLDFRIVEGTAALDTSTLVGFYRGKRLLREALGHRLPPSVRRHGKWGFGVPWSVYLRTDPGFVDLVDKLADGQICRAFCMERRKIVAVVQRFWAGDPDVEPLVRQLCMLAVWYDAVVTA